MKFKMPDYDIIVEKNSIRNLSKQIKSFYSYEDIFVVTDRNVDELYHDFIKGILSEFNLHFVVIKPGEPSKSIETYLNVIHQLVEKRYQKKSSTDCIWWWCCWGI